MRKKSLITGAHVQNDSSRKSIHIFRINVFGWEYEYSPEAGLKKAYHWLVNNKNKFRS